VVRRRSSLKCILWRHDYEHVALAQNFIRCDRDQASLLPPSLSRRLPDGIWHAQVRFVSQSCSATGWCSSDVTVSR